MLAVWAESVRRRDASIVDVFWGPAFVLVALVGALAGDGDRARRWLLLGLTAAWGLRLAVHLGRRKLGDPREDRRYAKLREREGTRFARWSLLWVFGLQGLLVLVVSLPLQVGSQASEPLGAAIVPGLALYALGMIFETVGDLQLARFRADPESRGQVMDRGLWRYAAPQLLRGRLRLVRALARGSARGRHVVDRGGPGGDGRAARARVGCRAARARHRGAAPGLRRVRAQHLGVRAAPRRRR